MDITKDTAEQRRAFLHFINTAILRKARADLVKMLRDEADKLENDGDVERLMDVLPGLDRVRRQVAALRREANATREKRGVSQ